ncbi:circadian clock protein KaiC [Bacillus shivajii]|uniref:ATPase domain-containing protein n=1 Tax=Bacillus shivajii TaxID=1983719 RepID=UPI001CF9E559|nr:ATPase domain-containing protein [Bacillus shivajii]UCZ52421.1 circadian clock protein KaiC [Bacillus shivajii]
MEVERKKTGIEGLDHVLNGGIPKNSCVILEGGPGTGKTNIGMQFLVKGILEHDEPGIYVTFEELPTQLYSDMAQFGWDLKSLERDNKLRILCLSPKILLNEVFKKDGLIESLINELQCKRIVIDSISLLKYGFDEEEKYRQKFYAFRNALKKYSLTSVLINEQNTSPTGQVPLEYFIVDGVFSLKLKENYEIYRKRTLEVRKMRGTKIELGEHIFVIEEGEGVILIPSLSMVEDKVISDQKSYIPTGLKQLDSVLGGGIPRGSLFMIDTNSKANYRYLLTSIHTNRVINGEKIITLLSSLSNENEIDRLYSLFDVSVKDATDEEKVVFIEPNDQTMLTDLKSISLGTHVSSREEFFEQMKESLFGKVEGYGQWTFHLDLNTLYKKLGEEFVWKFFSEDVPKLLDMGITITVLNNYRQIEEHNYAYLERLCAGVIKTWVDGNYQHLQVMKAPNGRVSKPFIVQNIDEKPFIRLI